MPRPRAPCPPELLRKIKANHATYGVRTMCRVLGVTASGYYAWRHRAPSARQRDDALLTDELRRFQRLSHERYGRPKLCLDLAEAGYRVSGKRVARLMRAAGLNGVSRRRWPKTTVRDRQARPAPDLVERRLWYESLAQALELTHRVRTAAAAQGRAMRFSVSVRPILAATESLAWARAERILAETRRLREASGLGRGSPEQSEGARRLLAAAERGDVVDKRLWTAIARETGARANTTALVGTPEQVAHALLAYVELGKCTVLIRGFDPLDVSSTMVAS